MKVSIGQDSHRFDFENKSKKLILGGVLFENETPLLGNSDGDVILHAITNAISWVTWVNIIWKKADEMCKNWILDSKEYLKEALKYLKYNISHVSISVECKYPKISPKILNIRENISLLLNIWVDDIWLTATSWEWLTWVWKWEGISTFVCITFV